jgi:5-methylcytosine-specific restriction endonuclease McrA
VSPPVPPPSAEAQLAFLAKLQRLFGEGDFTATYKFALLIALADLAVERGTDDGSSLELTLREVAIRFLGLYWHHVAPYGANAGKGESVVLSQNIGTQAAVLTAIADFRAATGAKTLLHAQVLPAFAHLVGKVAAVVSAQPVNYLQNFGGVTDSFLYERSGPGRIRLKEGVSFYLRRFYPLVQQLSRSHWVGHIKSNRRNQQVLGEAADLEAFLFSASRQSLTVVGAQLRKLDGGRCFYCGHGLSEHDVDHFMPFALYPRDLASNFVLAHPACNRSKSDSLAARGHLERWLERLSTRADDLAAIGRAAGLPDEPATLRRVAGWGYGNALQAGGRAWKAPSQFEPIDAGYLHVLAELR